MISTNDVVVDTKISNALHLCSAVVVVKEASCAASIPAPARLWFKLEAERESGLNPPLSTHARFHKFSGRSFAAAAV